MKRASNNIFVCIIPSFFLLTPVSLAMLFFRNRNINLGDKPARSNLIWGIVYFIFAGFFTIGFISSVSKRLQSKTVVSSTTSKHRLVKKKKAITAKKDKKNQKKKPHSFTTDVVMVFWLIGSSIGMGFLLLRYQKRLLHLQDDADTLITLVKNGVYQFSSLESHLFNNDAAALCKQAVKFQLLPGYIIDYEKQSLVSTEKLRKSQTMIQKSFRCNNCGAENNFTMAANMTAQCQYCGSEHNV